jgi:hypothetical protein
VPRTEVVWDVWNRKHLTEDHPERDVSLADVEDVLCDPVGKTLPRPKRGPDHNETMGQTRAGRLLFIGWVQYPEGRYPIHARPVNDRARRRFEEEWLKLRSEEAGR